MDDWAEAVVVCVFILCVVGFAAWLLFELWSAMALAGWMMMR